MFTKNEPNEKEKKILNYIINDLNNINDFNKDIQYEFVKIYPFMVRYIDNPSKEMILLYAKDDYSIINNYKNLFNESEIIDIYIKNGCIKDYNILNMDIINNLLRENAIGDLDKTTYYNILKYFVENKTIIDLPQLTTIILSPYIVFFYNELFAICTNNNYDSDDLGYILSRLYFNKRYYLINELIKTALFNNQEVLSHFIMNSEDVVRLPFNLSETAVSNLIENYKDGVDINYLLPYPNLLIDYINKYPDTIKKVPYEYIRPEMINTFIDNIEYFNYNSNDLYFKDLGLDKIEVNYDKFVDLLIKNVSNIHIISNIDKSYIDEMMASDYDAKHSFLYRFICRNDIDDELRVYCIKLLFKSMIEY